jgi:hypothetical protein
MEIILIKCGIVVIKELRYKPAGRSKQTEGQTHRYDEADGRFPQFCETV